MSVKEGQIYRLGRHRLACGLAEDRALVERLIGDDKVDTILTDPPYGVAYTEGKASFNLAVKHRAIQNDGRQSAEQYASFTAAWLEAAVPHLADKNSLYVFNCDRMLFALHEGLEAAGCTFGQLLVWVKQQPVMGRLHYLPQTELIAYGWYKRQRFTKSKDRNVIFEPRPRKSVHHPTQKPIPLLRRLILNGTAIGDVVYDPFGGSGSTLLAAEQTMRRCLTIECDEQYCQIIIDRFCKLTGEEVTLLP